MSPDDVFISHSSKDDDFVKELRRALEDQGLKAWVDSRELTAGNKLKPEIEQAIEQAGNFIVVLSSHTINSPWVRKEIKKALEIEKQRQGYKVIPLLLPGIETEALENWFGEEPDEEPVALPIQVEPGGLSKALPAILAALGERAPREHKPIQKVESEPVAELKLKLSKGSILIADGKSRATAIAQLVYDPADATRNEGESKEFIFTAPLGPIETEDLRWYLESYYLWPTGVFIERAEHIEERLPIWGQDLYRAATAAQSAQALLFDWKQTAKGIERRFSVQVDNRLLEGSSEEERNAANEAASALLSLPWELMHDGEGFLFQGLDSVRVRRRLPVENPLPANPTSLPIRILLISPRPEDDHVDYIDHRISARPLIEAVESLGELAELTVINPPTFSALKEALRKAVKSGKPFDVVHFDGHGVYSRDRSLGGLCFEDPKDSEKLEKREVQLVWAQELAAEFRQFRVPLVFLEACQSAMTEENPTASVAAKLLEGGVSSVIAMSHSVLVETARRFVTAFYRELAEGKRVGAAMLAGQRALYDDSYRGKIMGAGELRLQDWFVPVLYQEQQDPQLITQLPDEEVQQLQANQRRLSLGALPELTTHEFQGRSRELLALERLLHRERYAVVRGQGGAGKTTLAVELARWLVCTNRFRRAAFVSLEQYTDARTVLDSIGRQLLSDYSVSQYSDLKQALQPVERALADRATIIVLDNLESVLPNAGEDSEAIKELFDLCQKLLDADPATRIVFTSRELLPAPFDNKRREIPLGALTRTDAIALVSDVMKQEGLTPKAEDPGGDPQEIVDLVEAVNRHARALVLLAREVSRKGVRATTENLHQLMAELDCKHPGDRENSLYASVELSLRRLPKEVREQIKPLAVFHGGAHLGVLGMMLDTETVQNIALQLIEVGLAEYMGYNHLRLDPALPSYLLREMNSAEHEEAQARWAEAMEQLTTFLYQQRFKDAVLSQQLALLELNNLIAMLQWIQDKAMPEEVVGLAQSVEALLAELGRPQALAQATRVREQAAQGLVEWSRARYLTESASIDRLLERGDLPSAYKAVQQLLQLCLSAGEDAYPSADYDIAITQLKLGRVLRMGGAAEAALSPLAEAQRRFQALADAGSISAEGMASVTITERADCLKDLGRWDEATAAYEEAIRRKEKLSDRRGVAVNKVQIGTTRVLQGRFTDALEAYTQARAIFEILGEPGSVAIIWHQVGMAYAMSGQLEQAERAYLQSLAIKVQQKNLAGEASDLSDLGNVYDSMGRLEDAVKCYRQAADIYVKLQDKRHEGIACNNLADTLISLQRYDEARRELYRAIECNKPYGHAAASWKTWAILQRLEQAIGNAHAATQALQQAIESYSAYRRAGGQSQTTVAQLCALASQSIPQGETARLEQELVEWSGAEAAPSFKLMISKLQAILRGDRDPALADDPNLEYDDAVELKLLLEKLNAQ